VSENSLLDRVTAAGEERQLSQNTLIAYRRTWLKLIALYGCRSVKWAKWVCTYTSW
jgi:hypothetical protein